MNDNMCHNKIIYILRHVQLIPIKQEHIIMMIIRPLKHAHTNNYDKASK